MNMATNSKDAVSFLEGLVGPLTLGKYINAIRLGEEETLEAFAKKLGISKAHLCDVEKDRRVVSLERAARWAKLLGYPVDQFVQLAVQAELNAAGLKMRISVSAA
jgi:transcriptional regulator with XRE-family HTH domain